MSRYKGPPATLGSTLAAGVRLIVTCQGCGRQVEPDVAQLVDRHGADMPVPEWGKRLVCSVCGSRQVDFVLTGTDREDTPQSLGG